MGLINKYRYLQAILIGLPIGLLSLFYGTKYLANIKQEVNDYSSTFGIVDSIYTDYINISSESKYQSEVIKIDVNNNEYYVISKNQKQSLKENLRKKDSITLWYQNRNNGNKKIKAIRKNGVNIISYEPRGYWIGIFFIVLGLFFTVISFLYIVRHPEDLTGKKKK